MTCGAALQVPGDTNIRGSETRARRKMSKDRFGAVQNSLNYISNTLRNELRYNQNLPYTLRNELRCNQNLPCLCDCRSVRKDIPTRGRAGRKEASNTPNQEKSC